MRSIDPLGSTIFLIAKVQAHCWARCLPAVSKYPVLRDGRYSLLNCFRPPAIHRVRDSFRVRTSSITMGVASLLPITRSFVVFLRQECRLSCQQPCSYPLGEWCS